MRVIITGGTGLIGSALMHSFIADGHQVWILTRNPDQISLHPEGCQWVRWDGQSSNGWGQLVNEADVVVNLAGESLASGPWTGTRKVRMLSSRVQAGNALVEALMQSSHKPGLLVQSSAVGYYGVSQTAVFDENAPRGDDFLAKICGDWEESSRQVDQLGIRRIVIRTGFVLSLKGGAFPRLALPFRLFAGGPIGSGRQWISWIHLADQIGAIRFLIDHPDARGAYNLTAPEPHTNAEFGKILAGVMHRPYWLPVPAFALKLALGEMSTLVLDGQKAYPKNLLSLGYPFKYPRLEEALKNL